MKTMTRLLNRNRAGRRGRRRVGRTAVVLAGAGAAIAFAAPAFAAPAWVITPTVNVNPSPPSNVFTAVDARTSTDAWMVGTYQNPVDDAGGTILAEHWNGTAWSAAPTPDIFRSDEKLNAVSAAAANDVWAVGSKQMPGFAHTDPLTAHWDGTSWSIVPTPDVRGGSKSNLFGVANLGSGNAWAVGRSETARTLIEHWDGSAWHIIPAPDPVVPAGMTLTSSSLGAISARSANDIWAVGSFSAAKGTQSNSFTLTMHWNGSAWKIVPSPNPGTPSAINGVRQTLNGVVEISPTDAWAVGNTFDTVSGSFAPDKPIAMHWNGTAWSLTTVPNQNGGGQLAAVTASSPTSVWAAGAADGTSVLHWNGTSWTPETIPSGPDGPRIMTGISAVRGSATEVWGAAGTFVVHHP